MSQEDVLNFFEANPGKEYTAKEISAEISAGVHSVTKNLVAMRKGRTICWNNKLIPLGNGGGLHYVNHYSHKESN